ALSRIETTRTETAMAQTRGEWVAKALAGSWRESAFPSPLTFEQFEAIVPFLLRTGSGALAWRTARAAGNDLPELANAYRVHALESAVHAHRLERLMETFANAGIHSLLCKGWATAQFYAEAGCRPYGDFDLAVPASQHQDAAAILNAANGRFGTVDLHSAPPDLDDRPTHVLLARSRKFAVGRQTVTALSPGDQLRQACLHFARHGGWRPLWLCDVAAIVERGAIDWDEVLTGRNAVWVAAIVSLACDLFQAKIPTQRTASCPTWLKRTVLQQWSRGHIGDSHSRPQTDWSKTAWRVDACLRGIAERWPNRLEAAIASHALPETSWPGWCLQMRAVVRRTFFYLGHRRKSPVRNDANAFNVHQPEASEAVWPTARISSGV
ncbi:MAG: nucleotidyltransferase family protein, partial [Planctomycetota bacterium]